MVLLRPCLWVLLMELKHHNGDPQLNKHTGVSLRLTQTCTDLSYELQDFNFGHLYICTLTPAKLMFQRFCVRDTYTLQVPKHTHTF